MNRLVTITILLGMSGLAVATVPTVAVDAPPTLGLLGLGIVVAILAARARKKR